MVTLLRMNPDAFYQDNINALKRGAVLRIPSATEVNATSLAEATEAVRQQNEIWRGYQERAAGSATALADAGGTRPASSGASGAASDSRLELVPPRAASGDDGGADRPGSGGLDASSSALRETRADLARTQEDLASARQESSELRSRVADLEKIKSDQDRLLGLRDSELAAMQARIAELEKQAQAAAAAAAAAPVAVASEPEPTAEPDTAATPADDVSAQDIWGAADDEVAATDATPDPAADGEPAADAPASDEPVADDLASDDAAMDDEPVASDTGTTPAVTQPVSEPVEATPEPVAPPPPAKAWYENYYLLGGAAAALLALVGLVASRRRKGAAEDDFSTADSADDGVDFGIPASAAAHATADDGDFLYELQSRLSADPADLDAHLQLLRHLYAQGDDAGFEHAASAMLAQVDDQHGPEWSEARSLGEALMPGNPLFAAPAQADGFDGTPFDATSFDDSPTTETSATGADADDALSFDDFDEPAVTAEAPASSFALDEPAAPVEPAREPESLDFDFDFDSPTQVIKQVTERADETLDLAAMSVDQAAAESVDAEERESARTDAEFESALGAASSAAVSEPQSDELELPALDFDFSQEDEVKRPEVVSMADSGMDFESTPPAPLAVEPVAPVMVEAAQDQDDFLDLDFGSLGESDAVGTKLDLARAYIDMGDPEGARSMLEEVIAEGNSGQRSDAEKLMASLG
jgi:pilus assembly protein FimV